MIERISSRYLGDSPDFLFLSFIFVFIFRLFVEWVTIFGILFDYITKTLHWCWLLVQLRIEAESGVDLKLEALIVINLALKSVYILFFDQMRDQVYVKFWVAFVLYKLL
jgi:hypothetical protein